MDRESARLGIEALNREYAYCIDDGRFEEWPEFFTDPCRYQIMPRDGHERGHVSGFYFCDSKGMLKDRILCLRETSIYEPQSTRHVLNATRLTGLDGATGRAETNYLVVRTNQDGEMTIFAAGKYLDTVVFENGAARFKEKLVLTDSIRIEMLIAAPI